MKELRFHIEFLSDIVLPASSNTEGNIEQQEFIAGSNFLGMVATKYKDFSKPFDIFHSGNVRFGDAHVLHHDKATYKMPFSFFHEKLDNTTLYNHHLIKDFSVFKQLKQKRSGFITVDLEEVNIDYVYSQKSAYDKQNRRSMDSHMYGYNAMKKGTNWQFVVKIDGISNEDEKLIIDTLKSSKRLGKSKSSEYGQVKITYIETKDEIKSPLPYGEVFLYCNSRLALLDESGNPTYELKYLCNGAEINYAKSQIRTSSFTPYNGIRQTKDYERVCINKGSVIVVKSLNDTQLQQIQKGIGAYLSEGFGEIIINPNFLMQKEFELKKVNPITKQEKIEITSDVAIFLAKREQVKKETLDIAKEVAEFIKKNPPKEKLNSQWGTIRALTNQAKTTKELYDLIFEKLPEDKPKGFLRSKKAKDKWGNDLIEALEKTKKMCDDKELDFIKFTKLLSIQMPKHKMGGKND